MRLRLTLLTAASERDVLLTAPLGSMLADVAAPLCAAVGSPAVPLYDGSTVLPPEAALGGPGLRDGCVLSVGRPGPRAPAPGLLQLRVVGGRDAGRHWPLHRGEIVLGRGSSCEARLADPLSSARHARLSVSTAGVTVADLGSANGTWLAGARVDDDAVPLPTDALLRVGDSVLTLARTAGVPATVRALPDGGTQVATPPRTVQAPEPVVLDWPGEPEPRSPTRLALVALAVPVVAGVTLALLFDAPQFLLFTLLSPLMALGTWLSDRRGRRHGRRRDLAEHAAAVVRATAARDAALVEDASARRHGLPDLAELAAIAHGPGARLWERPAGAADVGTVRLGTGAAPTAVSVRSGGSTTTLWAPDRPVAVSLADAGVVGLAGPRLPLYALVRGLVAQLCVLHGPRDLRVLLMAASAELPAWAWVRWLPHLRRAPPPAELADWVAGRLADRRTAPLDTVVVVPDAARWRADPALARVLVDGPRVGVAALCLERTAGRLPAECRVVVEVVGDVGSRLRLSGPAAPPAAAVLLDGLSAEHAEAVARALAPLRDPAGRDGAPPPQVRLLDLLGLTEPTGPALLARWSAYGGTPRTELGHDGRRAFTVDLVRDGPHALVAGTTGAGKSQLLQALVVGLAATSPPEALQFVLVDYKGGAAFRDCARLPHTAGVVTDLDPHLTRRALRSLTAELTRRERLLGAAGASDLSGYDGSAGPLPRLVIVLDEFAALAQELPDFVGGLVAIAARGRSLGLHLVLATQRPGGAVTPEIRANTTLRIALRVTDEAESRDIVDQAGAARISRHTPGRALIRSGTEPAVVVQTGWVGAAPARPPTAVNVLPLRWPETWVPSPTVAGTGGYDADAPTDLQRLVAGCVAAATARGWVPLPSAWLPALPDVLPLDDLAPPRGRGVVLGLVDRPDEQARTPLTWDPGRDGSLLVAGGQRSGRTSALRTLLYGMARTYSADDLHVHVLDGGGALATVDRLPHVGTVVGPDDPARGTRLLARLVDELDQRRRSGAADGPLLLLVLDGWEGFTSRYEGVDGGRPVDHLLRLAREGTAAGIAVVVTSDRSGLGLRLAGVMGRRIVLPLTDRGDYALAGVPARAVPHRLPPGRAVLPGDDLEAHVAVVGEAPDGPAQDAALAALGLTRAPPTRRPPLRIAALPARLELRDLPPAAPRRPWLGVGGDDAGPLALGLDAVGTGVLVAGPPRSGRTSLLLTLARGLLDLGTPVAVVTPRRSPLRDLPGLAAATGGDHVRPLHATVAPGLVVLVDDLEDLADTPTEALLVDWLRADDGTTVVGAGRSEDLASTFRGLGVALRRRRTGVLLCPGHADGDLLGVRLPRLPADRTPGRGWLVADGELTRLQVASPGAGSPP